MRVTDVSYTNIRRNYYTNCPYETSFIRNIWNSYTKRLAFSDDGLLLKTAIYIYICMYRYKCILS